MKLFSRCEWLSFFLSLTYHNILHRGRGAGGGLWMAFIFFIFDISQHPEQCTDGHGHGCEWLSFFLSLTYHNIPIPKISWKTLVVNGFHFFYLWHITTSPPFFAEKKDRCEWLSFFLSLTYHNINQTWFMIDSSVVNGFHFFYLWHITTSGNKVFFHEYLLWMAFIFFIFDISQHRWAAEHRPRSGCEWLSFFLSLTYHNIPADVHQRLRCVVNGFHFFYLWHITTSQSGQIAVGLDVVICF